MYKTNVEKSANNKKLSCLAMASFILSIATVPFVVICIVIMLYNFPVTEGARLALYVCYTLIPTSLLLGFGGILHITLKRKLYYGYWMSLVGIGLPMILLVVLFYNLLRAMGKHMW